MLDGNNMAQVLWEHDSVRFIVKAPIIDPNSFAVSIDTLEEFYQLSIEIVTGEDSWICDLPTATCSGPGGEFGL